MKPERRMPNIAFFGLKAKRYDEIPNLWKYFILRNQLFEKILGNVQSSIGVPLCYTNYLTRVCCNLDHVNTTRVLISYI
jgi:hypothetical protein